MVYLDDDPDWLFPPEEAQKLWEQAKEKASNLENIEIGENKTMVTEEKKEMVNHPSHYQGNGLEVIDVIEKFNCSFCTGNAIKYILRAGSKVDFEGQNPTEKAIQDLEKAIWYINRRIYELKEDICD